MAILCLVSENWVYCFEPRDMKCEPMWLLPVGLWILWQKINPFADPIKIPHQSEIQMRLAFCSHYKNLEELKNNPNYEYIQPPIDKYASGAVSSNRNIFEIWHLIEKQPPWDDLFFLF